MLKYIICDLCDQTYLKIVKNRHNYGFNELIVLYKYSEHVWSQLNPKESLLLVDTDKSIDFFKSVNIPKIAILNPLSKTESLFHLPYLVENTDDFDYDYANMVYRRFYGLPLVIGKTQRTIIRELTPSDLEHVYTLYNSLVTSGCFEPLSDDHEKESLKLDAYYKNFYSFYGYGLWAVFHRKTGELIGRCGIQPYDLSDRTTTELGYLIKKNYQNLGLAYEVCHTIIEISKIQWELNELVIRTESNNVSSIALAKKLGFTPMDLEPIERSEIIGTVPDDLGTVPDDLGTVPDDLGTVPKKTYLLFNKML